MSNDLVSYSRAGDVFHYRWAARRALELVFPGTRLQQVVIEGSAEDEKNGEYGIDLSEYRRSENEGAPDDIDYFQLKHTTVQGDNPFTLSGLKDTLVHFAARFLQHVAEPDFASRKIRFWFVTNRPVDATVKKLFSDIVQQQSPAASPLKLVQEYTGLIDHSLRQFLSLLHINDTEADFKGQDASLLSAVVNIVPGAEEEAHTLGLVALMQRSVLPDESRVITSEAILQVFGLSRRTDLFPAPLLVDYDGPLIQRELFASMAKKIHDSKGPLIVHAVGGVGKSMFCRYFIENLPSGSAGVHYDCFGSGGYRRVSALRHRYRDALTQIANELASADLCAPILPHQRVSNDVLMRHFLERLATAVQKLQSLAPAGKVYILVDAADNAEMAALEFTDQSFARHLLREVLPAGCILVELCRTERIYLLDPPSHLIQLALEPFSTNESLAHLLARFTEATEPQGLEFHRLTGGNPRVQASVLASRFASAESALSSLGPEPRTVDEQIGHQLELAIAKMRDEVHGLFQTQIDDLCLGLATLPPHIPLAVLAAAAGVSTELVKSVIAEFGRSLWLRDDTVQFRDEPTETWFRQRFTADVPAFKAYIERLEPLAMQLPYVAMALPRLYLQAGLYDRLIAIALSDVFLPTDRPIEAREILVYRLEFAFKAALKERRWSDATTIAVRAGEEVSGNFRQLQLLENNIDLLPVLRTKEQVQDLAHQQQIGSSWPGAENIYSASLLSALPDSRGEARTFLRSAHRWLEIQIAEQRKPVEEESHHWREKPTIHYLDLVELCNAIFHLEGPAGVAEFMAKRRVHQGTFRIYSKLTARLIDAGQRADALALLNINKHALYQAAIISQLMRIGVYPEQELVEQTLIGLQAFLPSFTVADFWMDDDITPALLSSVESALHRGLDQELMLDVLHLFIPDRTDYHFTDSHHSAKRQWFLRALAIRKTLQPALEVSAVNISPLHRRYEENYRQAEETNKYQHHLDTLFPLYLVRAAIIAGVPGEDHENFTQALRQSGTLAHDLSYRYHVLPDDVATALSQTLIVGRSLAAELITSTVLEHVQTVNGLKLDNALELCRAAYRTAHLRSIAAPLEQYCYRVITGSHTNTDPETISERYILLARTVMPESPDDASAYFDKAVTIASKFGDERVARWEAVAALATKAATDSSDHQELAYRFIRCAEIIGEHVTREKHWDRTAAVQVTAKLSASAGLAALSRWRDREVGHFHYQLESVLEHLLISRQLSASAAWAFVAFLGTDQVARFLGDCLSATPNTSERHSLFKSGLHKCEQNGTLKSDWKELSKYVQQFTLSTPRFVALQHLVGAEFGQEGSDHTGYEDPPVTHQEWEELFASTEVSDMTPFSGLYERFNKLITKSGRPVRQFLGEYARRLPRREIAAFLQYIVQFEPLEVYDLNDTYSRLPAEWTGAVSFPDHWRRFLRGLSQRFFTDMSSRYIFEETVKKGGPFEWVYDTVLDGMLSGAAASTYSPGALFYFYCTELMSARLSGQEAIAVTSYALGRIELHIDREFGDGPWTQRMRAPEDVPGALAGFLWSVLGSPRPALRWKTAHAVRGLAGLEPGIIDLLATHLDTPSNEAFHHPGFPFYHMHAQLYFAIALYRATVDNPVSTRRFITSLCSLFGLHDHLIIKVFIGGILLVLHQHFPEDFEEGQMEIIRQTGQSALPLLEPEDARGITSYWHANGLIDPGVEFPFGIDIDTYWFRPLGSVFGISKKEVEDLVAHQIRTVWGYTTEESIKDPRDYLWNSGYGTRESFATHGDYPAAERLDFYLTYHGLLVVAHQMLQTMPMVRDPHYHFRDFREWLADYQLIHPGGYWLADYRAGVPVTRPPWVMQAESNRDEWLTGLIEQDFKRQLFSKEAGPQHVVVGGGWTERRSYYAESVSVSTALVPPDMAPSLLRAMSSFTNPHDFKLPAYRRQDDDYDSILPQAPLLLEGWIYSPRMEAGIDRFDPLAAGLDYQWLLPGDTYAEALGLHQQEGTQQWLNEDGFTQLECVSWVSGTGRKKDEEPNQAGMQLWASGTLLRSLCQRFNRHLIFRVIMDRTIQYSHGTDRNQYSPDLFRLFIFTADGQLYFYDPGDGTWTPVDQPTGG